MGKHALARERDAKCPLWPHIPCRELNTCGRSTQNAKNTGLAKKCVFLGLVGAWGLTHLECDKESFPAHWADFDRLRVDSSHSANLNKYVERIRHKIFPEFP